jgi:hypothetical protein
VSANDSIKAIAAAIVTALSGFSTLAGIDPATAPYIVGLLVTGITSLVSAFYAIRRLRAGEPVAPQGELPL